MDIIVSAIVADLISRSASFMITKYFQQQPDIDKILQRLERVVLRIDIVIEEAEGRAITNQGMLHQLRVLRQGMYRGRYVLDALRFQAALDDVEGEGEEETSHTSSALSKSSLAKRLCFSRTRSGSSNREALLFGSNMREELQQIVNTLEHTMAGMKEFLFFLETYPRILRQPYGTYLILDNCMFGRQAEQQWLLNFLLCPSATTDLAVLPIVGPIRVGKTTLVEHVCRDETVRDHFSMVLFFPEGSLNDEGLIDLDLRGGRVQRPGWPRGRRARSEGVIWGVGWPKKSARGGRVREPAAGASSSSHGICHRRSYLTLDAPPNEPTHTSSLSCASAQ